MSWTLGRVAFALICLAAVLIMCAGYVGLDALIGAAVLVGVIGFALLVVRTLR